ncbi:diaminopimelate epimerase [Nocardioides albertanoniae]|uniref:Diaminopimelate epimerase n=1 Tax=Nocardioides albertanoniae TaxID=1175486 RepID=A0A543A581_9ACTN|nr:diaminopimelate epimerase [Nocardioides albertanoniae]TQL67636.1 diaminopimelate epimerase [Nocardioides albertanoniae]
MARDTAAVEFVKLSPTSNTTLLVTSRHAPDAYRPIATQLLSATHVHAEQVGFVTTPSISAAQVRLHMAGDEFCGNASMALAVLTAAEHGLAVGKRTEIALEASGTDRALACRVEHQHDGYRCDLAVPAPSRVEAYPFSGASEGRSALVRYPDAVHLVVECDRPGPEMRERAEVMAAYLGATEGVSVVGVMLYDPLRRELAPLVNVPALGTMVWERSCGSGTAALGAYLATRAGGPVRTSVHQPGGRMHVWADLGPTGVTGLRIGGHVGIVAEGTAYVHV